MLVLSRLSLAFFAAVLLATPMAALADGPETLPVKIDAKDASVHYVGRWDMSNAKGPACDWPASEVALHFQGTAINVQIGDVGNNYFQVVLDGEQTDVLKPSKGQSLFLAAKDLADKEHTIEIVKRTESSQAAWVNKTPIPVIFQGFEIAAGGKTLPWTAKPAHHLEIIGDSISCGYGNEDTDKGHHFKPDTENAYMTYGLIAARSFNAECTDIAWSGRKMFPNFTIPEIYKQTLGNAATPKWDFAQISVDAVVINLSTNDFSSKNHDLPDSKGWIAAYEKFVTGTVRTAYPNADIFIATSPMLWGDQRPRLTTYLTTIQSDLETKGDKKVYILDIPAQDPNDGYGADWHPNIATHKKMAAVLEKALEEKCGWKPLVTEDKARK